MKFKTNNNEYKKLNSKDPAIKIIKRIQKIQTNINTIYNIGSNIGKNSILLSLTFPHSKIYDFEPNDELSGHAKKNMKKYKLHNIQIFNYAIGKKQIKKHIFYNNELSTLLPSHAHEMHSKKKIIIEELDKLAKKFKLEPPSLLRIGVAGYGTEAILGTKSLIIAHKPIIWYKWDTHLRHLSEEYMLNSINLLKELDYIPFYASFSREEFIFVHKSTNQKEKLLNFKRIMWSNRRRDIVMNSTKRRFKYIFVFIRPFISYYFYLKGKHDPKI